MSIALTGFAHGLYIEYEERNPKLSHERQGHREVVYGVGEDKVWRKGSRQCVDVVMVI